MAQKGAIVSPTGPVTYDDGTRFDESQSSARYMLPSVTAVVRRSRPRKLMRINALQLKV